MAPWTEPELLNRCSYGWIHKPVDVWTALLLCFCTIYSRTYFPFLTSWLIKSWEECFYLLLWSFGNVWSNFHILNLSIPLEVRYISRGTSGRRVDVLSTRHWMSRVLIRVRLFFIVCTRAGFDRAGKHFLLAWNLLASGATRLHVFFFFHPLFLSCLFYPHPTRFTPTPSRCFHLSYILPPSFTLRCCNQLWPSLLGCFFFFFFKLVSFTHGKCFLFASRAADTISFALTSSLVSLFRPGDTKPILV